MASTSHPSRILFRGGPLLCVLFLLLARANSIEAQTSSQFTLSLGEAYNDNIFLSENKEHDFITLIRPALTWQSVLPTQPLSTLAFTIAPIAQIYALHSNQNSFGGGGGSLAYVYPYSPTLSFNLSDVLNTQSRTRVLNSLFPGGTTPNPGVPIPPSGNQQTVNSLSLGREINNSFFAQAQYLYSPEITVSRDDSCCVLFKRNAHNIEAAQK